MQSIAWQMLWCWRWICSNRANSLASSVNRAGACEAPNGSATKRAISPLLRRKPMYLRAGVSRMAWWKPCHQSRLARYDPADRKGNTASIVGRCRGKGVMAALTPVMVGSM
jgi:hypothetical protein